MKLITIALAAILITFTHLYAQARCSVLFGAVAPRGIVISATMKGVLADLFPELTSHAAAKTLLTNASERVPEEDGSLLVAPTSMGGSEYRIRFLASELGGREIVTLRGIQPREQSQWETQSWEYSFNPHLRHHIDPSQISWNSSSETRRDGEIGMDAANFWSRVLVWSRPLRHSDGNEKDKQAVVKYLNWKNRVKTILISYRITERGNSPENWKITGFEIFEDSHRALEVDRLFGNTYAEEYSDTSLQLVLDSRRVNVRINKRNDAVLTELEGVTRADLESAFSNVVHRLQYTGPTNGTYLRIVGVGENGKLLSIRVFLGLEGREESPALVHAKELRSDRLKNLVELRR